MRQQTHPASTPGPVPDSDSADEADVVIVGYGPVGQGLALLLGQAGHRVVVLERHPGLHPLPRAAHLDGETMRTLQSMGVAETIEPLCHPQRLYEFLDAEGRRMFHTDFSGSDGSGWRSGYFFSSPDLEGAMHDAVLALPSVEPVFGHEVVDIIVGDDAVSVVAHDEAGAWRIIRARYVIGADGATSTVRRQVGVAWEDLDYSAQWLVIDLDPASPEVTAALSEACQILDPARPVSVFRRIGTRHARLEFMLLPGETIEQMQQPETAWRLLAPFGITPAAATLVRQTVYTFRSLLADTFDQAPVFLAGDAAHLMPPFLGQGMCSGLRDAAALSWRLDAALRREPGSPLGEGWWTSYTAERRRHVRAVIDGSIAIGNILGATPGTLGETRTAESLQAAFAQVPGVLPPLQAGAIAVGEPLAGELLPQLLVEDGAGRPARLDDVIGRRWLVLLAAGVDQEDVGAWQIAGAPVTVLRVGAEVQENYGEWLSSAQVAAVLVRPDSIIVGGAVDVSALRAVAARVTDLAG